MKHSVVIAEDYKMVREVFASTVKDSGNYELAGAFASAAEAMEHCLSNSVDLVIMDVLIPGSISGLEAARRIKAKRPQTKVIIVTSMPELSFINQAREIGIESFWYKEIQEQPLLEIMDRTMDGEYLRVVRVVRELVGGASNREIADKLCITENTVKMHITNMLQKTGFHSRLELAVKARHLGVAIKD